LRADEKAIFVILTVVNLWARLTIFESIIAAASETEVDLKARVIN
jgi:hypothetical protein